MPYQPGGNLPGEYASKLGHLDVVKSELMDKLIQSFESQTLPKPNTAPKWESITTGEPLSTIYSVDGSYVPIPFEDWPYVKLGCVKVALVKIDKNELSKFDTSTPHPMKLRDLLSESVLRHVNLFPLRHVSITGTNTYHAVRRIVFDGMKNHEKLGDTVLQTLKWLAYEKWDTKKPFLPNFGCPHCEKEVATIPYDCETGNCPQCSGELYLTDWLGFHQRMAPDNAPEEVAIDYMNVYELLLLFTKIRLMWEDNPENLSKCLFVKDGPLQLTSQFAKLVPRIRKFLEYSRYARFPVYLVGQEKRGRFYEHLELIGNDAPDGSLFVLYDRYIKEEIQQRPNTGFPYGEFTNYGAKILVKFNHNDKMVISIPTGEYKRDPKISDLIGLERILATLPEILSRRFQGGLLPVELAHGIASLSNYPSARLIKDFTNTSKISSAGS